MSIGNGLSLYNIFPIPVGGVIYLEDKVYDLQLKTITLSDSIRFPENANCKILNGTIVYTGSGVLFNTPVMGSLVKRLSDVFCIFTGGGTMFNISGVDPTGALVMDNMANISPASIGTINGVVVSFTAIRYIGIGTGLVFSNISTTNIAGLSITGTNQATTFLSWEGVANGLIDIVSYGPTIYGNEHALNFDSGTTFNEVTAHGCTVCLGGTATIDNVFESGSENQKTGGFKFTGNTNIPDSTVSARIGFQDSTTETVIDQTEVPVRVNGTYIDGFEERTSYTSNGVITYIGAETITASVRSYISLEPVTGVTVLMGGYIAKTESDTYEVTFTNATNVVDRVGHGLANDTSIRFSTDGTLPAEIRDDQFYWVINTAADTFQISNTEGGAAHTFTDDGTGTHYYSLGEYIDSSEVTATPSSNAPGNLVVEALVELSTGDKIEAFVDNHDTTSNILVTSINNILTKG